MKAEKLNIRQRHGVSQLAAALKTADKKAKGIAENSEEINLKMREILDVIDNPVPNRRIEDYE